MIATETKIKVQITPKAANSPTWPFSQSSKIATETTGVCGLTRRIDIESSLAESRKTKTHPPRNDGVSKGSVTRRIAFEHEAPEVYEAYSSSRWSWRIPEWVQRMPYGMYRV